MALKDSKLPLGIIGRSDLIRMQRDLSLLDDFFVAAAARKSGTAIAPPRVSHSLEALARDNQVNLLEAKQRHSFSLELKQALESAPQLHISFATEPSPKGLEQILAWFRDNIHPQTLFAVGIQPAIAAGCVLRTPNQIFDMSLATNLKKQEPYLAKLLDGAADGK